MKFDVIGDVHGHHAPLVELLEKLGYACRNGVYRHADRRVIFLGDFIDRGPYQREVLEVVRPMIDDGAALSVMGNHEFNAIAYFTEDPEAPGTYLRPHSEKNARQHRAFREEFEGASDYPDVIEWFRTLPLWLDIDGLRVVHACWDEGLMRFLETSYPGVNSHLSDDLLVAASRSGSDEYRAIETLLKGKEIELPKGQSFRDKDGNPRHEIRVQWWNPDAKTYRRAFLGPASALSHIPEDPIDVDHLILYSAAEPPVFVGHYWMEGEPTLLAPNVACLDYSVASPKGGRLVAYRWDGEQVLNHDNFVSVVRVPE